MVNFRAKKRNSLVTRMGQSEKKNRVPLRNQTLDLRILCSNILPMSHRHSMVSKAIMEFIMALLLVHILHTVFYTFPEVLTRRICLPIKSFFHW